MRSLRRMDTGSIVDVYGWATTKNWWEYYFLRDKNDSRGNRPAIVMGFETEVGDVHIDEIMPHVVCFTNDLADLQPPEGWEWVDGGATTAETN